MHICHDSAIMIQLDGDRASIACTPGNYMAVVALNRDQLVKKLSIG